MYPATGGLQTSSLLVPVPSPDKMRRVAAGRASGVKLCPKEMDMWTNRRPDLARASLRSDAQRNRRDSARSGLRLLHQEQVRLKKRVQTQEKETSKGERKRGGEDDEDGYTKCGIYDRKRA